MEMSMDRRPALLLVLLSAVLLSLAAPSVAYTTNVKYCTNKAYPVKVKGVDITPYPIPRGEEVTFSISATAGDVISKGKLVIDVSYWIFHVHSETHDICTETSCPVTSGDFVLSHKQTLPGITPPGSYTLTLKMLGGDGKELTCVEFGFNIGFLPSVADS